MQRSRRVSRSGALALVLAGLLGVAGACWLASRGTEPVATWLYPFAWYPLLLAVEGGVALRRGRFLLLADPGLLLSVLGWSVPLWMLWEVFNFRLENWYYVFVPDRRAALWTGVVLSFATVLPACFLPAALVWPDRPEGRSRSPAPALSGGVLRAIRWTGAVMLLLPLIWPRFFFPLVWGGFVLLLEPDLLRAAPSRSLLADAVRGRWDRIGSLLAGGALAGLAWEGLNVVARGSWIYTVPGLEELKLFEMPLLGFFGFPPLALSCFTLYQWLALRGWAVPLELEPDEGTAAAGESGREHEDPAGAGAGEGEGSTREGGAGSPFSWGVAAARTAAAVLVAVTLLGMEAWTISSRTPRLRDLPDLLPSEVETLGAWGIDSPFALARAEPGALATRIPGVDATEARRWVESARLATTRGMGTRNARLLHSWGIRSPAELARTDPGAVAACFRARPGEDVRPAQVRVWWRAAVRDVEADVGAERTPTC